MSQSIENYPSSEKRLVVHKATKPKPPSIVLLTDLDQGWKNPKGDAFFQKQRRNANKPSETNERFFYDMMKKIGKEMHECTGAFRVRGHTPA